MRGFSTALLDEEFAWRTRDCHPRETTEQPTEHSPDEGQCGKHWIHQGTIPPPLLSQGCLKVEQGVMDGSCSSSLPQPPLPWSKMYRCPTPKQYNCSIDAPSTETSSLGLVGYNTGGSTFCMAHLPSATYPRQNASKLQPCCQGCHTV